MNGTILAGGAVTYAKMADDSVDFQHIVAGAVQTADIGAGAVMNSKLAGLAVENGNLAGNSVTSDKIQDDQVFLQDLRGGSGTAVIDPNSLLTGECSTQTFIAPTLSNGDIVVINYQTTPDSALEVTPLVATGPDLRLRLCNRTSGTVDAAAFAVTYFSLR